METMEIAARYGLPTLLLAGFAIAAWKAAAAAWRDIVLPSRDRAFQFLDKVERNVDTFSDNLEKQTRSLEAIERTGASTAANIAELKRTCELRGLGCGTEPGDAG
jgi:hypothetical protein